MTDVERAELRDEVRAWFFDPGANGPTSLSMCCAVIGLLDVDAVRDRAWRRLGRDFKVHRRPRLTVEARRQILKAMARGVSSIALGEQFGVNPGP